MLIQMEYNQEQSEHDQTSFRNTRPLSTKKNLMLKDLKPLNPPFPLLERVSYWISFCTYFPSFTISIYLFNIVKLVMSNLHGRMTLDKTICVFWSHPWTIMKTYSRTLVDLLCCSSISSLHYSLVFCTVCYCMVLKYTTKLNCVLCEGAPVGGGGPGQQNWQVLCSTGVSCLVYVGNILSDIFTANIFEKITFNLEKYTKFGNQTSQLGNCNENSHSLYDSYSVSTTVN